MNIENKNFRFFYGFFYLVIPYRIFYSKRFSINSFGLTLIFPAWYTASNHTLRVINFNAKLMNKGSWDFYTESVVCNQLLKWIFFSLKKSKREWRKTLLQVLPSMCCIKIFALVTLTIFFSITDPFSLPMNYQLLVSCTYLEIVYKWLINIRHILIWHKPLIFNFLFLLWFNIFYLYLFTKRILNALMQKKYAKKG